MVPFIFMAVHITCRAARRDVFLWQSHCVKWQMVSRGCGSSLGKSLPCSFTFHNKHVSKKQRASKEIHKLDNNWNLKQLKQSEDETWSVETESDVHSKTLQVTLHDLRQKKHPRTHCTIGRWFIKHHAANPLASNNAVFIFLDNTVFHNGLKSQIDKHFPFHAVLTFLLKHPAMSCLSHFLTIFLLPAIPVWSQWLDCAHFSQLSPVLVPSPLHACPPSSSHLLGLNMPPQWYTLEDSQHSYRS